MCLPDFFRRFRKKIRRTKKISLEAPKDHNHDTEELKKINVHSLLMNFLHSHTAEPEWPSETFKQRYVSAFVAKATQHKRLGKALWLTIDDTLSLEALWVMPFLEIQRRWVAENLERIHNGQDDDILDAERVITNLQNLLEISNEPDGARVIHELGGHYVMVDTLLILDFVSGQGPVCDIRSKSIQILNHLCSNVQIAKAVANIQPFVMRTVRHFATAKQTHCHETELLLRKLSAVFPNDRYNRCALKIIQILSLQASKDFDNNPSKVMAIMAIIENLIRSNRINAQIFVQCNYLLLSNIFADMKWGVNIQLKRHPFSELELKTDRFSDNFWIAELSLLRELSLNITRSDDCLILKEFRQFKFPCFLDDVLKHKNLSSGSEQTIKYLSDMAELFMKYDRKRPIR